MNPHSVTAQDILTLRDLLAFAQQSVDEIGPCDHGVNICVCGARRTIEDGHALLRRLSGQPAQRDPDLSLRDVMPSWMLGQPLEMD